VKQVGLIGYPVAHSLSPQMYQAAFDALGIDARYALWETRQNGLAERIASLRSPDVLGANVTIPYKQDVMPLVDECDPLAARIGAINTIANDGGRLVGYNTDAPGFIRALAEFAAFDCRGKKVVILGTGGAARAAAVALLESEVEEVMLLGRTKEHINGLVHHLRTLTAMMHGTARVNGALLKSPEINRFLSAADLVVNATPIGLMADDTTLLFDINVLPTTSLVMDMIFNPPLTPLLRVARAHGCYVLNGLAMLLYQGARAFEIWTGRTAPIEVMRRALGLVKERNQR
jgi:shikimate dehydrogenase